MPPCGAAARAGLAAMGFQLFADPAYASNTVTSAHLPEGVEWSALSKALRARETVLAGGQGKLTGKVFRIGHLGAVNVDDIVRALEALEDASREVGIAGLVRWSRRRCRRRPGRARRREGDRLMARILVAEPLAEEGVSILRCPARGGRQDRAAPRGAARDPARVRRAARPLAGQGGCRGDRRGPQAPGDRPRRRRRGQHRARSGDRRGHRGRQRAHGQHGRRRGAHPRAAVRARPPHPGRGRLACAGASGSARRSPGASCAARPWASSAWARSA